MSRCRAKGLWGGIGCLRLGSAGDEGKIWEGSAVWTMAEHS